MHPDRKIGIAMGILLVGVVGALFFRNEPLPENRSLSREREEELNQRLRDRDVSVYLDATAPVANEDDEPVWTLEEALTQTKEVRRDSSHPVAASIDSNAAGRTKHTSVEFRAPTQQSETIGRAENFDGTTVGAKRTEVASRAAEEAEEVEQTEEQYEEYRIQFGDTLSGISQKFLGTSSRYTDIYRANQDRIDNPDRLRVGTAIRIPRVIR